MRNILFLLLTAGLYFGLHLFVYFSTVRLFGISAPRFQASLLIALAALSLSFPISAAISRSSLNLGADLAYRVAATWIGLLIFLAMSFAAVWFIHLALGLAGVHVIRPVIWGSVAVTAAVLATVIGSVAALRPTVTDVTVPMKNLPAQWADRTVIQLSDVHLGKINGTAYAERLVAQVNTLKPDVIFITGDLFDGMGSDPKQFIPILNGLQATQGVYYVTGNHEHYLGVNKVLAAMQDSDIRLLDNERVDIDGLQVIGLSFPGLEGQSYPADVIPTRPGYDRNQPTVLLYHEPINVNHQSNGRARRRNKLYFAPNTDYSTQRDSGVDLQLSGHTHAGQFTPFTLVARRVFNGFQYGLHADGTFSIYITSGTGTWGPPLRLGTRSEIVRLHLK